MKVCLIIIENKGPLYIWLLWWNHRWPLNINSLFYNCLEKGKTYGKMHSTWNFCSFFSTNFVRNTFDSDSEVRLGYLKNSYRSSCEAVSKLVQPKQKLKFLDQLSSNSPVSHVLKSCPFLLEVCHAHWRALRGTDSSCNGRGRVWQ
jgi:hypothetical protein